MAIKRRTDRLNSLLKEVLSDVILNQVKNPDLVGKLISVTKVEITKDLRHAKVYISVIGDNIEEKKNVIKALTSAAGFISVTTSKQVVMHHFPSLTFILDDSVEKQMRIHEILSKVEEEKKSRALKTEVNDESEHSQS